MAEVTVLASSPALSQARGLGGCWSKEEIMSERERCSRGNRSLGSSLRPCSAICEITE